MPQSLMIYRMQWGHLGQQIFVFRGTITILPLLKHIQKALDDVLKV